MSYFDTSTVVFVSVQEFAELYDFNKSIRNALFMRLHVHNVCIRMTMNKFVFVFWKNYFKLTMRCFKMRFYSTEFMVKKKKRFYIDQNAYHNSISLGQTSSANK